MDPFPEEYLVDPGEEPSAFNLGGELDDPFAADWRAGEHQIGESRRSIDSGPGWGMNMHGIDTPLQGRSSMDSRGVDGLLGGTAPGSLGSAATGWDMRRVGSDPQSAPDPQPTASPKYSGQQECHEQRPQASMSPGAVLEGLQINNSPSPETDEPPVMQQRHAHAQADSAVKQERANTHHPFPGGSQGQQLPPAPGLTYAQQVATLHSAPPPATLEATQGQILSQSPTDATRFWWHLYGS